MPKVIDLENAETKFVCSKDNITQDFLVRAATSQGGIVGRREICSLTCQNLIYDDGLVQIRQISCQNTDFCDSIDCVFRR